MTLPNVVSPMVRAFLAGMVFTVVAGLTYWFIERLVYDVRHELCAESKARIDAFERCAASKQTLCMITPEDVEQANKSVNYLMDNCQWGKE